MTQASGRITWVRISATGVPRSCSSDCGETRPPSRCFEPRHVLQVHTGRVDHSFQVLSHHCSCGFGKKERSTSILFPPWPNFNPTTNFLDFVKLEAQQVVPTRISAKVEQQCRSDPTLRVPEPSPIVVVVGWTVGMPRPGPPSLSPVREDQPRPPHRMSHDPLPPIPLLRRAKLVRDAGNYLGFRRRVASIPRADPALKADLVFRGQPALTKHVAVKPHNRLRAAMRFRARSIALPRMYRLSTTPWTGSAPSPNCSSRTMNPRSLILPRPILAPSSNSMDTSVRILHVFGVLPLSTLTQGRWQDRWCPILQRRSLSRWSRYLQERAWEPVRPQCRSCGQCHGRTDRPPPQGNCYQVSSLHGMWSLASLRLVFF